MSGCSWPGPGTRVEAVSEVEKHYANLLAEHYTWMLGPDFGELVDGQRLLLAELLGDAPRGLALDLGAGSGIQSIALAQLGFAPVLAVDSSAELLTELGERHAGDHDVQTVHADIRDLEHLAGPDSVAVAVCMGDTLTHLPDRVAVQDLVEQIRRTLSPGGRLVLSFRDLTEVPTGLDRFIPVRSTEDTIMTCFIEQDGDAHVRVHDLIHSRQLGRWALHRSSYRKLILSAEWVAEELRESGLVVDTRTETPSGLQVIAATRP